MPTFTDLFCGAGGASQGLREAGFEIRVVHGNAVSVNVARWLGRAVAGSLS